MAVDDASVHQNKSERSETELNFGAAALLAKAPDSADVLTSIIARMPSYVTANSLAV